MKWTLKREPFLALMLAASLCVCLVLSGVSAKAEPAPAASGVSTSTTALSASAPEIPAPKPTVRFEAELLSFPAPQTEPAADEPEETPEPVEPAEPVLTPVVAQYASEMIQSSAEATHIPENLAACTADADIPDDLEHIDSFIATAYYVTGTTSTGAYTTVGRTLAVNPNIIPYGTQVWMFLDDGTYIGTFTAEDVWLYLEDGTFAGDFIAEDTGSNMLANSNVIDIYMGEGSYHDCILWGAQHVNLYTTPAENAAE